MFQEIANNWVHGFYSFVDVTSLWPVSTNLWNKKNGSTVYADDVKIKHTDILLGYLVLFWATVYLVYEKCLNSLLRRMRFPLMQRRRIIEAMWGCGFSFGSICYLMSSLSKTLSFPTTEWKIMHQELGVVLHKSFYFHHAAILILYHGAWTRGLVHLFFASFVLILYQENWCMAVNTFLYYKAFDSFVINVCRILMCMSQDKIRMIAKVLFSIHCLNWIYMYIRVAPATLLWPENVDHSRVEMGLWLWYIAECVNSVWVRLCGCAKATHWLEICIYLPPTQEAIELASIRKKHGQSAKPSRRKGRSSEMLKTLLCAMTITKKIRRMRQAKLHQSSSTVESDSTIETNEVEKDITQEE